jgi:hypothetical protein
MANNTSTFQKINRFLEYFWLFLTLAAAALAIYFIYEEGYEEAKWHLLFPLLAFAMYIMRRGLRKRFEANMAAQAQENGGKPKKKEA